MNHHILSAALFIVIAHLASAGPPRFRPLKACPQGFKAVHVQGKQDCVCEDFHVYWPKTGLCYLEFVQGPCKEGQTLRANATGHAECRCAGWFAPWTDGKCYPEYSQGPCPLGKIFIGGLSGEGVCHCSPNIMQYYPKEKKCYALYEQGPCAKGHILKFDHALNQPKCVCKDKHMLGDDGVCYRLNTAGPCDQSTCTEGINCYLKNIDTLNTECKCLPGNVTTVDGRCYEPYSRGDCSQGEWLVYSEPGVAVCKSKGQCSRFDNWFFWEEDEVCYRQYTKGPCTEGKLFYLDPNTGESICDCRKEWAPYYWPENGKCYEQHSIGPCPSGKYFSFNKTSSKTECNCFTSHVLHKETGKCYERMTVGPCPMGELVVADPKTQELKCSCTKEMTKHYWPKTGHCYQHFKQGPCAPGQTYRVNQATELPSCVNWWGK